MGKYVLDRPQILKISNRWQTTMTRNKPFFKQNKRIEEIYETDKENRG